MTCTPILSSSPLRRLLDEPAAEAGVVRLTLQAGAQASVDVGADRVTIDVRRGSVWLTQDANDHVLPGGATFDCDAGRRVVMTALADVSIDVRRDARR